MPHGRLEQVPGTLGIHLEEVCRPPRLDDPRDVHDGVHAIHRRAQRSAILDRSRGELDPRNPVQDLPRAVRPHQGTDHVPFRRELLGHEGPQKS